MTKQKQCAYWFLTINPSAECYSAVQSILDNIVEDYPNAEYSYIYHHHKEKDDSDNENHIHLVIYFKGSVKRFTTMANIFVGAHIELSNKQRYYRCIQYLIHKNDVNKYQYDRSEILTNISNPILDDILINNGYEFDYFDVTLLEDYIKDSIEINKPNVYYFIKRFGLDAIKPYYFIIKDLLKDTYEIKKMLSSISSDEIYYN